MEIDPILDRLAPALAHEYDRDAMYAAERERNRAHNAKYAESIRASARRRALMPKNKIKAQAMGRLVQLMTHPRFEMGEYPSRSKAFRNKAIPYENLLGASATTFRAHLESLFTPDMAWANYGKFWHIGHRVPCRLFDCSDPAQLRACFYYKNLQPELPEENTRRMNEVY